MNITAKDKEEIKNLIAEKEAHIDCEIVPMMVKASSSYNIAQFRLAIIFLFIFSLIIYYSSLSLLDPSILLLGQSIGLLLGYFLATIPAIKRLLITRHEMDKEVSQHAYESFMHHNLHLTKNHNGLLIYISTFERKIKIIADNGIIKKVDNHAWDNIVANFVTITKNENILAALKATISSTAEVLVKHFPASKHENNELSNNLIIE